MCSDQPLSSASPSVEEAELTPGVLDSSAIPASASAAAVGQPSSPPGLANSGFTAVAPQAASDQVGTASMACPLVSAVQEHHLNMLRAVFSHVEALASGAAQAQAPTLLREGQPESVSSWASNYLQAMGVSLQSTAATTSLSPAVVRSSDPAMSSGSKAEQPEAIGGEEGRAAAAASSSSKPSSPDTTSNKDDRKGDWDIDVKEKDARVSTSRWADIDADPDAEAEERWKSAGSARGGVDEAGDGAGWQGWQGWDSDWGTDWHTGWKEQPSASWNSAAQPSASVPAAKAVPAGPKSITPFQALPHGNLEQEASPQPQAVAEHQQAPPPLPPPITSTKADPPIPSPAPPLPPPLPELPATSSASMPPSASLQSKKGQVPSVAASEEWLPQDTFDCPICLETKSYQDVLLPHASHKTLKCKLCRDCGRSAVLAALEQAQIPPPCSICLASATSSSTRQPAPPFCEASIASVLTEEEQVRWRRRELEKWRDNCGNAKPCPKTDCNGIGVIDDQEGGDHRCRCPICETEWCATCDKVHDRDTTCKDHQTWLDENGQADERFQDYVKTEKVKKCPRCKQAVEKSEGCNHITCRCKHHFCYVCGKTLEGDPYAHFRRPPPRCPLFDGQDAAEGVEDDDDAELGDEAFRRRGRLLAVGPRRGFPPAPRLLPQQQRPQRPPQQPPADPHGGLVPPGLPGQNPLVVVPAVAPPPKGPPPQARQDLRDEADEAWWA
mmetsp:Transcript_2154/g.5037  ORF Transcript_2154/g.5037 Transcript_2154/m.5037 type:complete len:726 (+) Transcript_2154:2287-4464(+)